MCCLTIFKLIVISVLILLSNPALFVLCCNRALVQSKNFLNGLFEQPVIRGYNEYTKLDEISGLAASRRHKDVLYALNDSGGKPRIFALNATTADLIAILNIQAAMNCDWEDIAVGPGPYGQYYIYIGDIGGNTNAKCNTIYRVREPLRMEDGNLEIHGELRFTWNERNCETILVDEKGTLYLLAKVRPGELVRLYEVPNFAYKFKRVTLDNGTAVDVNIEDQGPTGGDISINGREILIRTYNFVYYWRRHFTTSLSETLTRAPVKLSNVIDEPQGEAICWDSRGDGFYTISEGPSRPLIYYAKGPSLRLLGNY